MEVNPETKKRAFGQEKSRKKQQASEEANF